MPTQAPRPKLAPDPHDTYVKKVFGELPQARAFFRAYLSENVQALFDWRTLRLECVNFIPLSVTDEQQQAEVRGALQSVQDEFLPVKEHLMTLLEHLKKEGKKLGQRLGRVSMLTRQLSAAFPEFSPADAKRVRALPDEVLDQLADAIALRRTWAEIQELLQPNAD
jgi:hypothetical protein